MGVTYYANKIKKQKQKRLEFRFLGMSKEPKIEPLEIETEKIGTQVSRHE